MRASSIENLQTSVLDKAGFSSLREYKLFFQEFLKYLKKNKLTRIISPSHSNYIFYQYSPRNGNKITRPLNSDLFIESQKQFESSFKLFLLALKKIKKNQGLSSRDEDIKKIMEKNVVNKVVYSLQQGVGCIGDSFNNPNTSRKRIGQIFENLIRVIIDDLGLECSSRTIKLPIQKRKGYSMSYELDLVFSRKKAILTSENQFIHENEIVGSVKTTSKDRLDKIFLDKFMLKRLIGRDIPVVALFLHDVQRAVRGNSIFSINSTFKRNHFLGYSIALNKLDGIYYVDPRPEMKTDKLLKKQISSFQDFIARDLWSLSD